MIGHVVGPGSNFHPIATQFLLLLHQYVTTRSLF
jgi:hypothetical protein